MSQYEINQRNKVKRVPERGAYDKQTSYEILDAGFFCHLGFNTSDQPFVIPTLYGRKGDKIFVHGASTSRLITELNKGIAVCLTVTHIDGLVLARSAFHHSMNYRSVVVFGTATIVSNDKKVEALKVISDNVLINRWEESRQPNAKELKATTVLEIAIEQASSKIRSGDPSDDKEDYELDIWAGVVPIDLHYGKPIDDDLLKKDIKMPPSVSRFT